MAAIDVNVPDIGDFKDVPVIEVLVKPGDSVEPEDPLVTLESDKATMDVPSPARGVVKSIRVKVGDKVSEGSALVTLESATSAAPSNAKQAAADAAPPKSPAAPPSNALPRPCGRGRRWRARRAPDARRPHRSPHGYLFPGSDPL